ncbi:DUF1990 family protein [Microbacterium sp. P06]|uniref:DUF1990 family protein n=1 Tax=Microbacterium sp. P06 TaxID=3366949 RepID=UPI003745DE40
MTDIGREQWGPTDGEFRRSEISAVIGSGGEVWDRACDDVLRWRVKTRSGFRVETEGPVRVGDRPLIRVRMRGLTVVEPVEVIDVVLEPNRVGFAYRTLPGHPVRGEEAFIVDRSGETVSITVRSLTAASDAPLWRAVHPLLRIAQRFARRRYLRALS